MIRRAQHALKTLTQMKMTAMNGGTMTVDVLTVCSAVLCWYFEKLVVCS
jgi:hypothetical protein